MDDEHVSEAVLSSVAVGLLLGCLVGVAAIGLLVAWAQPWLAWLGVALIAILGVVAFCVGCLWSAHAGGSARGAQGETVPQVLVWAERAVLSLVALGVAVLLIGPARSSGSGAPTVFMTLLGTCVIVGAVLGRLPRALLAVEGAMCAGYVAFSARLLAQAAGCWDCRDGDMTEGGYAIFGLGLFSFWLVTFLGAVASGAIVRRLLR